MAEEYLKKVVSVQNTYSSGLRDIKECIVSEEEKAKSVSGHYGKFTIPICEAEGVNTNGVFYSRAVWDHVITTQKKNWNGSLGYSNHPDVLTSSGEYVEPDLQRVCVVWTNLRIEHHEKLGREMLVADGSLVSDAGKTIRQILDCGGEVCWSVNGLAEVEERGDGTIAIVANTYHIVSVADWVVKPAFNDARIEKSAMIESNEQKVSAEDADSRVALQKEIENIEKTDGVVRNILKGLGGKTKEEILEVLEALMLTNRALVTKVDDLDNAVGETEAQSRKKTESKATQGNSVLLKYDARKKGDNRSMGKSSVLKELEEKKKAYIISVSCDNVKAKKESGMKRLDSSKRLNSKDTVEKCSGGNTDNLIPKNIRMEKRRRLISRKGDRLISRKGDRLGGVGSREISRPARLGRRIGGVVASNYFEPSRRLTRGGNPRRSRLLSRGSQFERRVSPVSSDALSNGVWEKDSFFNPVAETARIIMSNQNLVGIQDKLNRTRSRGEFDKVVEDYLEDRSLYFNK